MTDKGLDLSIDETKTGPINRPYLIGWGIYVVEDAVYFPPGTDESGHRYSLTLRLVSENSFTDADGKEVKDCRTDVKLTYFFDKKEPVIQNGKPVMQNGQQVVNIVANDNSRGTVRKLGRIRYGEQYMKVPTPDMIVGLICMAKLVQQKTDARYVNCYEFALPPADWFVWHAGNGGGIDQYAQIEGQPLPTKFNADGTYAVDG